MRELLTRLAVDDPDASDALKVLEYFDVLDANHAGPEAYLRGAAAMSSCIVGLQLPERHLALRVDSSGRRVSSEPPQPGAQWLSLDLSPEATGKVWLENDREAATFHHLLVERVARGVGQWVRRIEGLAPTPREALATLLNDPVPAERQRLLRGALRINPDRSYRLIAFLPDRGPQGLVDAEATIDGRAVGAAVIAAELKDAAFDNGAVVGVGPATRLEGLFDTWACASTALKLTDQGVTTWDDLGVLGPLFRDVDVSELDTDPLVAKLDTLDMPWLSATVDAITNTGSARAASLQLDLHHSSVQKRIDRIRDQLGLDLTQPREATTLWLALRAHRFIHFGRRQ